MTAGRASRVAQASRLRSTAIGTGLWLASVAGPQALAQTSFEPRVAASAVWTDNIDLSETNKRDAFVGVLMPGLHFEHTALHLSASLDYQLQALFFDRSDLSNQLFHTGNLAAHADLLPEWLFLDLSAVRTQTAAGPSAPATTNTLFPTGNLANRTGGDATASLRHSFSKVKFDLSYTRALVRNQGAESPTVDLTGAPLQDSNTQVERAELGSVDEAAAITWSSSYERQQTDYQEAFRYLHERALADVGVLVLPELRLIGRVGRESDPYAGVGVGGLGASSWEAGFDWKSGDRNELRALAGHRFYGTSYEALWLRRTRLLELQVTYSETPTTSDSQFLNGFVPPPALPLPSQGTQQGGVGPTSNLPIPNSYARLSSDVYLLKDLTGRATLKGRLTEIGLTISSERRKYVTVDGVTASPSDPGLNDVVKTADLYLTRRLGPRIEATLTAGISDVNLRQSGGDYKEHRYVATLTDHIGHYTSVNLRLDHDQRLGAGPVYTLNMVMLTFQMGANGPAEQLPGGPTPNYLPAGR
jgi:uncharacterized protein (PEP-CTERM system associated)